MDNVLEMSLPLVVSVLALFPTYVMSVAYRRTKSRRVYWATLAFFLFTMKGVMMFLGIFAGVMTAEAVELFEFSTDTAILALFTMSLVVTSGRGARAVD